MVGQVDFVEGGMTVDGVALIIGAVIAGILFLGAIGAVVLTGIVRMLVKGPSPGEILQKRYAQGELTREQYERMRQDLEPALADPDPSWSSLYRAGAVSAGLVVGILLIAIIVDIVNPPALTLSGAATLQHIAAHRSPYIVEQVLWLVPSVFAIVVFMALYAALQHLNRSYAAITTLLGIVSWALTLASPTTGGGSPILAYLSDHYATATSDVQRTALASAAEGFIAWNNVPSALGVLQTAAILAVSLLMLKGVFPRGVAYLGIATGSIGIVSEALRPIIGAGYGVYGVLLLVWFGAVGWKLYKLS